MMPLLKLLFNLIKFFELLFFLSESWRLKSLMRSNLTHILILALTWFYSMSRYWLWCFRQTLYLLYLLWSNNIWLSHYWLIFWLILLSLLHFCSFLLSHLYLVHKHIIRRKSLHGCMRIYKLLWRDTLHQILLLWSNLNLRSWNQFSLSLIVTTLIICELIVIDWCAIRGCRMNLVLMRDDWSLCVSSWYSPSLLLALSPVCSSKFFTS